jgi:predicted nucleic acid-binding protein
MRYALDTSCLVALHLPTHERHDVTLRTVSRRDRAGEEVVLAAPALLEAYAVLTRLPGPHRLAARDAYHMLSETWGDARVIALTPDEHWRSLDGASEQGIHGGLSYDAAIAACARKGRVQQLLTWNTRHFEKVAVGIEVREPAG